MPPDAPPPAHEASEIRIADPAARSWRAWGPWAAAVIALVAVAAALRLWDLPLAPFHNDEGVNGWFTYQLLQTGTWHYDPANYHGPTLFYAEAPSVKVGDFYNLAARSKRVANYTVVPWPFFWNVGLSG